MDEIMQFLAKLPVEERLEAVQGAFEDQRRLNKLQALTEKNTYTGTVLLSLGKNDLGWQLRETGREGSTSDVREAIDNFFVMMDPEGEIFG